MTTLGSADAVSAADDVKIMFDNVSKRYVRQGAPFVALDRVSLAVRDHEFLTVIGPSGCGKSTLMSLAAGLATPSSGTVKIDGEIVDGPSPKRGVIFQQYALFPWLTVRQNVEFGLRIARAPKELRRQRAEELIDTVGLSEFADELPKALSGGMKQRCALARAYAVDPMVLLMDEPFGALDALTRVHLQDSLLDMWRRDQRTVLFITHDVDEAIYLGSRLVVMATRPGRIKTVVDIGLPYPRTEDVRLSDAFARIRAEVWQAVYHQDAA